MKILKNLLIGDILIILTVLLLSIISFLFTFHYNKYTPTMVEIYLNGELIQTSPLSINSTILIEDKFSNTIIIENNHVKVINSTCPDGVCENFGYINSHWQSIVCAPNKLVITVTNDSNDSVNSNAIDVIV